MSQTTTMCAVCAWRSTCQKKFTISGRDMRCAEFERDVTLGQEQHDEGHPPEA